MKAFKQSLLILLIINLHFVCGMAQTTDVSPEIINAFETGNSISLSNSFSDHIELAIEDKEAIYSKSQAKQIMSKFFREYPPTKFNVKHVGSQQNTHYVIGTLFAENETFRINFLLKKLNSKTFIHQLRIEVIDD